MRKNDYISRQDAIRWVKTECNPYGKPTLDYDSGKKVIEHLKHMPSVEPDCDRCIWDVCNYNDAVSTAQTEQNVLNKDLISRKAAIEAMGEEPAVWTDSESEIAERNQWQADVNAIMSVPSVQPEYKTDHGYMWICPTCGLIVHSDFDKCVRCGHER